MAEVGPIEYLPGGGSSWRGNKLSRGIAGVLSQCERHGIGLSQKLGHNTQAHCSLTIIPDQKSIT
jgi:hypothetical protein